MWFSPTSSRTQSHQLNSLLISNLFNPFLWTFLLDKHSQVSHLRKASLHSYSFKAQFSSWCDHSPSWAGGVDSLLPTAHHWLKPLLPSLGSSIHPSVGKELHGHFLVSMSLDSSAESDASGHPIPDLASCPDVCHHSPSVSFFPHFLIAAPLLPHPYQGCPHGPPVLSSSLLSTHDLTTPHTLTLKNHFSEDAYFLLGSLSVTSEPHFQLSEGYTHLPVLQTEQIRPAKFKALTPQEFCISAVGASQI